MFGMIPLGIVVAMAGYDVWQIFAAQAVYAICWQLGCAFREYRLYRSAIKDRMTGWRGEQ